MDITYRSLNPGEESQIYDLITRVFDEFVAPGYSEDGIREFLRYVHPDSLLARSQANHFVLIAEVRGQIVGTIEMRNNEHLSLLFVASRFQRQGISRELLRRGLEICRSNKPDLTLVTVNSSPYAVPIYECLGFQATGPEQVENGIRFIPMLLDLAELEK